MASPHELQRRHDGEAVSEEHRPGVVPDRRFSQRVTMSSVNGASALMSWLQV